MKPAASATQQSSRAASASVPCERIVAIVGLARSGTTLLAAMLSAHPDVHMVFEPWNATKREGPRRTDLGVEEFFSAFDINLHGKRILGVKETAQREYLDGIRYLLLDAAPRVPVSLIWVYRNPLHTYLSHVQAMKEWWGHPDHEVSLRSFDMWAASSVRRMRWLLDVLLSLPGACLSYEALASNPAGTMQRLTHVVGIRESDDVLDYHRKGGRPRPRGDRRVRESPMAASSCSMEERDRELIEKACVIETSKFMPVMRRLCDWGDELANPGLIAGDHELAGKLGGILPVLEQE